MSAREPFVSTVPAEVKVTKQPQQVSGANKATSSKTKDVEEEEFEYYEEDDEEDDAV